MFVQYIKDFIKNVMITEFRNDLMYTNHRNGAWENIKTVY
jgi:hypothetical protein